jgi:hypothetical protein
MPSVPPECPSCGEQLSDVHDQDRDLEPYHPYLIYCPSEGCPWTGHRPCDFKMTCKKKTSPRRINLLGRRETKYMTQSSSLWSRTPMVPRLMRWCGIIKGPRKVHGVGQRRVSRKRKLDTARALFDQYHLLAHATLQHGIGLRPLNTLQFISEGAYILLMPESSTVGVFVVSAPAPFMIMPKTLHSRGSLPAVCWFLVALKTRESIQCPLA